MRDSAKAPCSLLLLLELLEMLSLGCSWPSAPGKWHAAAHDLLHLLPQCNPHLGTQVAPGAAAAAQAVNNHYILL
jgi:hypothetical protein